MATISQDKARCRDSAGIRTRRVVEITGPASYATGGDPLTAGELLLGKVECFPSGVAYDATPVAKLYAYDYDNEKLLWFVPDTNAEVADGTDLSAFVFRVEVIGK